MIKTQEQQNIIDFVKTGKDLIIQAYAGAGKAQPVWCKVQTPKGEIEIGNIKVGDEIFKSDGSIGYVTGVFPQGKQPYYKITFRDGSYTYSNAEHLWQVYNIGSKKKNSTKTVTLQTIIDYGVTYPNTDNYKWKIPLLSSPLQYQEKQHLIHPYLLGILIGDGYLCGTTVSFSVGTDDNGIEEIIKSIIPDGYYITGRNTSENCMQYNICSNTSVNEIRRELLRLGLCVKSHEKFIPDEYKHDSIDNRLWLIRGLMDSDGACSLRNSTRYCTTSLKLLNDVKYLCQQLGWTAIEHSIRKRVDRINKVYSLNIKATTNPFFHRKSKNWSYSTKNPPSRFITNIELVGEEEQVCIKVSADDSLYLTDQCIVTHNTSTLKAIAEELSDKNILYIAFNKAIVEEATKKMPSNVTVKTIHSVAYANSNKDLLQRLTYTKKLDIPAIASICKLNSMTLYNNYTRQKETFNSYRVASWALKVATAFMHSSKKDIKSEDVYLGKEYNHLILNESDKLVLSQAAKKIWLYYENDNTYHITHDVYLKIFGMSKINLNYDIILIDECQDVSGIMLSFLNSQINSQKIYVGDQFQKIYSFTGSIDITKQLTNVTTLNLTRTFRFGENIAVYANHWIKQLNENALKLKCNDSIEIPELETHAILCRSNAAVIEEYLKIINNDSTLKCNVSCDINSITLFFNALKDIDENKKTNYPILSYFNSIKSLYDWVENNDFMLDTDFLQNIKLSKKFNYKLILPILNNYKTHKYPDIVISTVHKAKGLEWDEVTLGSDFNFKNDEELRLFYVAITRARYKLNNYKKYDISHRTVEQMRIDIGVLDPNKAKKDFKPIVQNTVKHNTNTFKSNSHNTTKYNKAKRY